MAFIKNNAWQTVKQYAILSLSERKGDSMKVYILQDRAGEIMGVYKNRTRARVAQKVYKQVYNKLYAIVEKQVR